MVEPVRVARALGTDLTQLEISQNLSARLERELRSGASRPDEELLRQHEEEAKVSAAAQQARDDDGLKYDATLADDGQECYRQFLISSTYNPTEGGHHIMAIKIRARGAAAADRRGQAEPARSVRPRSDHQAYCQQARRQGCTLRQAWAGSSSQDRDGDEGSPRGATRRATSTPRKRSG